MKKILLALLVTTVLMSTTCSKTDDVVQTSAVISAADVPAAVKNAFAAKYPAASGEIEWQKEDSNTYKVKFFIGSQRWQAIFKADGSFISEKAI